MFAIHKEFYITNIRRLVGLAASPRPPANTGNPLRADRTGWLLLAAAALAGAVSARVTWWSGPFNALTADAFQVNRFDVTDIVPVGYAIFAMALGICAGTLLRRTLPALGITLVGFGAVRVAIARWLRLH